MKKIFKFIIVVCLITCAYSNFVSSTMSKDLPVNKPVIKKNLFDWLKVAIKRIIESLKNASGLNINPHNRCVWKICSKPLKNFRSESFKDQKIYNQSDKEVKDLITSIKIVYRNRKLSTPAF